MLVGELQERLKNLNNKISDLEAFISDNELEGYNDVLQELFNLYDSRRSYSILLRRSYDTTKIKMGKEEISIADAKALLDTVTTKVATMTKLIENLPEKLNIFQIIQERDKLVEELIMLKSGVEASAWSTEID